jgi:hypothetical protein
MDAMLYSSAQGALVLVPACFEPSMELQMAHGRLLLCCRVELAALAGSALGRRVAADFDQCTYAMLSPRDARRLFGSQALWGSSDRRLTPREVLLSGQQVRQRMSLLKRLTRKPTSIA